MIVLIGESGCGKSTVERNLVEKGYKRSISHTSRPIRLKDGEVDGVQYFFKTREEMLALKEEGFFVEFIPYLDQYYGLCREQCKNENIVVVEPTGLKQLHEKDYLDITVFYLYASEEIREQRMLDRGDHPDKVLERIVNDREIFKEVASTANYIIQTDNKTIDTIVEEILTKL